MVQVERSIEQRAYKPWEVIQGTLFNLGPIEEVELDVDIPIEVHNLDWWQLTLSQADCAHFF